MRWPLWMFTLRLVVLYIYIWYYLGKCLPLKKLSYKYLKINKWSGLSQTGFVTVCFWHSTEPNDIPHLCDNFDHEPTHEESIVCLTTQAADRSHLVALSLQYGHCKKGGSPPGCTNTPEGTKILHEVRMARVRCRLHSNIALFMHHNWTSQHHCDPNPVLDN